MRFFFDSSPISESRFWTCALLAYGLLVSPFHWVLREGMNPDGVSYIDLGRMVQEGQWGGLVNSYWAPMLPVLLSLCELEERFAPVQVVLGLVSLAYLGCGAFVLREVWRRMGWQGGALGRRELSVGVYFVGLLTVSHVVLTGPQVLTPDGLAGCFALAAAGLLLRAERLGHSVGRALVLGLVLGGGYLAKYPLFLFGGLLLALVSVRQWRFALVGAGSFGLVAGPWVLLLSARYGRWTFADSGWLNFAWFTGQAPRLGAATAFVEREGATYAAWLDPGMVTGKLELVVPWARLLDNVVWHLSWATSSPVLAGLCLLAALHVLGKLPELDWRFVWPLLVITSYLPVTLMCRYAAVWVALLFGMWGVSALTPRRQVVVGAMLLLACGLGWRRMEPERLAAERSVAFAERHPELRGRLVYSSREPFGASIDLVRLRARVAPKSSALSHTIEGQWQILDSSDSASWATPWRGISLKQGTR